MRENLKLYNVMLLLAMVWSVFYFKPFVTEHGVSTSARNSMVVLLFVYVMLNTPNKYKYKPVKVFMESVDELNYLNEE